MTTRNFSFINNLDKEPLCKKMKVVNPDYNHDVDSFLETVNVNSNAFELIAFYQAMCFLGEKETFDNDVDDTLIYSQNSDVRHDTPLNNTIKIYNNLKENNLRTIAHFSLVEFDNITLKYNVKMEKETISRSCENNLNINKALLYVEEYKEYIMLDDKIQYNASCDNKYISSNNKTVFMNADKFYIWLTKNHNISSK